MRLGKEGQEDEATKEMKADYFALKRNVGVERRQQAICGVGVPVRGAAWGGENAGRKRAVWRLGLHT